MPAVRGANDPFKHALSWCHWRLARQCFRVSRLGSTGGQATSGTVWVPRGPKPAARGVVSCLIAVVLMGVLAPAAVADQVVVGETSYPRARVVGFEAGELHFVSMDGMELAAAISEIQLLIVDSVSGFADFNEAERLLADGKAGAAIVRYERAMRLGKRFWPDLIAARLLAACDRAARIDRATMNFIRVARGRHSGPESAAQLIPQNIPRKREPEAVRAVEQLDAALRKVDNDAEETLFRLLRYSILHQTGDERAARESVAVVHLAFPKSVRSPRAYAILLKALRVVLAEADSLTTANLSSLDRAIADCPEEMLPSFLLLKGGTLLRTSSTREEIIRASWPLLRVVIHMPDDPRAAEGLLEAAVAMERLGRPGKAAQLLEECLGREDLDDKTRSAAEEALRRMRALEDTAPDS